MLFFHGCFCFVGVAERLTTASATGILQASNRKIKEIGKVYRTLNGPRCLSYRFRNALSTPVTTAMTEADPCSS